MVATGRRSSRARRRKNLEGYLLISPWLLGFFLFVLGPVIFTMVISFTDWDIVSPAKFVGLSNYLEAFTQDRFFMKALSNTLYYTFGSVPLCLLLALVLALILNRNIVGLKFWRTALYLPSVISMVSMGLTFDYILQSRTGVLNYLLSLIGIKGPGWLSSRVWSKPALIMISLMFVGPQMVVFLAGLKGIPESLYESAELDGAGTLGKFRHITLPLLSSTIFFNLVTGIINAFQVFEIVYVVMGINTAGFGHGPLNSTLVYAIYLYENAFRLLRMGYATGLAWVLFVIVLILTVIQLRFSSRWVFYQGGGR